MRFWLARGDTAEATRLLKDATLSRSSAAALVEAVVRARTPNVPPDDPILARANALLARVGVKRGDAGLLARGTAAALRAAQDPDVRAALACVDAELFLRRQEFDVFTERLPELRAATAHDPVWAARLAVMWAAARHACGPEGAAEPIGQAVTAAEASGSASLLADALGIAARHAATVGRTEEARALLARCTSLDTALLIRSHAAAVHALLEEWELEEQALRDVLEQSVLAGRSGAVEYALLHARVLFRLRRDAEAEVALSLAERLARARGRPDLLGLIRAYRLVPSIRAGRWDEVPAGLAAAESIPPLHALRGILAAEVPTLEAQGATEVAARLRAVAEHHGRLG